MSNTNTTFLAYNPIPDNIRGMISKASPSNIRNYVASKIATENLSNIKKSNPSSSPSPGPQKKSTTQVEEKKEPSFGKFIGYTITSILAVIIYFTISGMFLEYANFYSRYKMNGRFPDGPPYTTNFPYKNIFTESPNPDSENLFYRFFNWITQGLIHGFSSSRYLLDMFFDYTGRTLKDSPDIIISVVFLFAPLLVGLGILFSPLIGGVNTLIGLIENGGLIIPDFFEFVLLALPLLIPLFIYPGIIITAAFATASGVGISQAMMLAAFLLIMPLFNAKMRDGTINKILNNKYLIILTMFIFTTVSAFTSLDQTYGYVTLGMSLAALLVFIFMKFF